MNKKQKILYILTDIFVIGTFLVMPFFNFLDFHKKLTSSNTAFASVCGDGVCSGWENPSNCPEDCSGGGGGGGSSCVCGDGYCNSSCENSYNCPEDCGSGSSCVCGDGYCNPSCENSYNCPEDCSGGSSCVCGDGYCNPSCENSYNCPEDCGSPPPSCHDECSYSGQRRCSGAYSYQVCGNYDSDPCLEWSSPQSCPSDRCIGTTWRHYYCSCGQCKYTDTRCSPKCYSCGDGVCNSECGENSSNCPQDCGPSCHDECSYLGQTQKRCYQGDVQKRICGNYDSDPCLEWSSWQTIQDCGESGWTNEYRCSSHYLQRKYIERGCSNAQCYANEEWRNYQDCGQDQWTNNYRCQGNWVQREKIKRGCSNNQCYENRQWVNYQNCEEEGKICQNGRCVMPCINDPVEGTLSVSPQTVYVGGTITIRVSAQDDNGLVKACVKYKGSWHCKSMSGNSDTKTWAISESTPGTYTYCAKVYGWAYQESCGNKYVESAKTKPYCVSVKVLAQTCTLDIYTYEKDTNHLINAKIYVDGDYKGRKHVSIEVNIGTHNVEGRLSGYLPDQKTVSCSCGETKRVELYLEKECTPHAYKQCYNNDVYWYDSCGNREEKAEECGESSWTNDYRCSGNWVQRKYIERGCQNAQCYEKEKWINYQNCEEEGKVCQDGRCVWGCEDECSFPGQKRCQDDSHYQVCGNYDDDVCLEWSSPISCGEDSCIGSTFRDYFCTGWGICTYQDIQCSSQCYSCGDGTCNSECGENSSNCPQDCGYPQLNVTCQAQPNPAEVNQVVNFIASATGGTGQYSYSWTGSCEGNQQICSTSFSNPGNYCAVVTVTSGDQTKTASCFVTVNEPQCECSAWSDWQNQGCGKDGCAANQMYQIRTRDCNPDGCDVEQESRCVEDPICQPQNDPVSGTLSVSPTSLCVGQQINLTISGQDDDGLSGFYAYFQGNWHWQDATGTSDTKTWTIIENTPGVYTYCGQVYGKTPQGITETTNTSPYCVNVEVSSCQPSCTNECSYVGEVRCYDSTHRQICGNYDSDVCLEWSSPELCSGPTNCGYGNCASNQRPNWYCSNGTCTYSCIYDSTCETPQNYLSCFENDVWWFSGSTHQPLSKYQECGEDSCDAWGEKYCQGNKVYQKRTCYDRGCANGSCYSNQYTDTRLVEECAPDETCVNGECKKECECSSGPCCDGCHYKPETSVCDVKIETQYGCPWGTGCGADVGKRTRSKFRYCSGNSASCNGRWGSWSDWTSWRVADYCTINEVCRPGYQKCQYKSSCVSPGPSYIKHYKKVCVGNSLWWYDSNNQKQDKYRDCIDDNTCTQDFCENGKCVFELKCDGTTCPVGSQDYCESCEHCGDGVCNCQEDICSCPQDCKIEGMSISLLAKLEKQPTEWQDEVKVEAGDIVDFLLVISNHGEQTLSNLNVKIDLPSQIQYLDEAKSEGQAILGDLESGVNIGNIEPRSIKTITFKGKIASKELLHDINTLESLAYVQGDGLSASDSVRFTIKTPFTTGGLKGAMVAALKDILKGWLIWLLLILLGIVALFMAVFYLLFWLVRKRREKEMKATTSPVV